MKKYRSVLMLGVMSSVASTQASGSLLYHSGFYGVAELGYIHEDHHDKFSNKTSYTFKRLKQNTNSDKFFPALSVGYRHFMNCYFLGIDVGANLNPSEKKVRFHTKSISAAGSSSASTSISTVVPFDIPSNTSWHRTKARYNILPAIIFGHTSVLKYAFFFKVGADFGKYKYQITDKTGFHKTKDFSLTRLLLGGGIEYAFNPCWAGRFTIDCSLRKTKSFKSGKVSTHLYKSQLKISTTALKFGLMYKL